MLQHGIEQGQPPAPAMRHGTRSGWSMRRWLPRLRVTVRWCWRCPNTPQARASTGTRSTSLPAGSLSATRDDLTPDEREGEGERITRRAIPVPVSFRGMPASRWWEFEDARVNFGAVTAGPQQLVRRRLIEFALVSGDD